MVVASLEIRSAATMYKTSLDFECPTCGARPGASCVRSDESPKSKLHRARIAIASKKNDVRELQDKIKGASGELKRD